MSDASRVAYEEMSNKSFRGVKFLEGAKSKIVSYGADGAIDPTVGVAKLTKGSAGAHTLRAPTAEEEGLRLDIISGSAFAHVVTATDLLNDGVTGGPKDTITFAAFVGAAVSLIATGGQWTVLSLKATTVAAV